jgi:hypothetical protein
MRKCVGAYFPACADTTWLRILLSAISLEHDMVNTGVLEDRVRIVALPRPPEAVLLPEFWHCVELWHEAREAR